MATKSKRASERCEQRTRVIGALRIDLGLYEELKADADRLCISLTDVIRLRLRGHSTRAERRAA